MIHGHTSDRPQQIFLFNDWALAQSFASTLLGPVYFQVFDDCGKTAVSWVQIEERSGRDLPDMRQLKHATYEGRPDDWGTFLGEDYCAACAARRNL